MPTWMRWGLEAFQKVGFPAAMCLLIWYRDETVQKNQVIATQQLTVAMDRQADRLENLVMYITANHIKGDERWEHFLSEFRASRK